MTPVYINKIKTAVPEFAIHEHFLKHLPLLFEDERLVRTLRLMAIKSGIKNRYSVLDHPISLEGEDAFYKKKSFPGTEKRMSVYSQNQAILADKALAKLFDEISPEDITHLIFATCTGFAAPGPDAGIIERWNMSPFTERTQIGFMGCFSALIGLRQAFHMVRSVKDAKVLLVNLEQCTLHLQDTKNISEMTPSLLFADGCAAALISSQPQGLRLNEFHSRLLSRGHGDMGWNITDHGFAMHLSSRVSSLIEEELLSDFPSKNQGELQSFAIHPGGKKILDAVESGLHLEKNDLQISRFILENYGNMSSATVLFVLEKIMEQKIFGPGISMAFGPGLSVEMMRYEL